MYVRTLARDVLCLQAQLNRIMVAHLGALKTTIDQSINNVILEYARVRVIDSLTKYVCKLISMNNISLSTVRLQTFG